MPSWFMLMPSETEIVVNSRGVPPASAMPSLAASTWKSWVMLQGVCSPFMLTTPIIGFAMRRVVEPHRPHEGAMRRAIEAIGRDARSPLFHGG